MDVILCIVLYFALLIVFCIVWLRERSRKEAERARQKAVNQGISRNYKLLEKAMQTPSAKTAENYLLQAEANYHAVHHLSSGAGREVLEHNIQNIRDEVEEKQRYKWESNARKILSNLFDTYSMIINHSFDNVERAYKAKARCMKYWDQYWQSIEDYDILLYPKQFFKNSIASYDPCFEDRGALEQRLDQAITEMKPEYKRKMALYKKIMDAVAKEGSIMRSDLTKKSFPDAVPKEVECCYKELIKKYKLVEVKLGNRYFVSLSDKELEKRNTKASASTPEKETK